MFYVQVIVVDENGVQQNDADVTGFESLEEAFAGQARADAAATESNS